MIYYILLLDLAICYSYDILYYILLTDVHVIVMINYILLLDLYVIVMIYHILLPYVNSYFHLKFFE